MWHTDPLDRTNLSFSFSPPLLFSPRLQSLDPANDSWKNNSENERATTIERWDPVEDKGERMRGRERERKGGKRETERKRDDWIWLRGEKNDTLAMDEIEE